MDIGILPEGFAAADFTARMWNAFTAVLLWGGMYFGGLRIANWLTSVTTGKDGSLSCLMDEVRKGTPGVGEYLGRRNQGIAIATGLIVAFIWKG